MRNVLYSKPFEHIVGLSGPGPPRDFVFVKKLVRSRVKSIELYFINTTTRRSAERSDGLVVASSRHYK